jgi:hypothetical protein
MILIAQIKPERLKAEQALFGLLWVFPVGLRFR